MTLIDKTIENIISYDNQKYYKDIVITDHFDSYKEISILENNNETIDIVTNLIQFSYMCDDIKKIIRYIKTLDYSLPIKYKISYSGNKHTDRVVYWIGIQMFFLEEEHYTDFKNFLLIDKLES